MNQPAQYLASEHIGVLRTGLKAMLGLCKAFADEEQDPDRRRRMRSRIVSALNTQIRARNRLIRMARKAHEACDCHKSTEESGGDS